MIRTEDRHLQVSGRSVMESVHGSVGVPVVKVVLAWAVG